MKKIIKYFLYFIFFIVVILAVTGIINSKNIKKGNLEFTSTWQGKLINIDGETIRYLQKGTGKDILLIHGTPGSIEDWQPIIDSLANNYRVTAFDRLGNGFSSANNYNYTLNSNIKLINKLIIKLNLHDIVVVGHSYGGSIAAKMATTENKKIKSFIIIAAPLYQIESDINYTMLSLPIIGKGLSAIASKTIASNMIDEGLTDTFGNNTDLLTPQFIKVRKQIWSQAKVLYTTSNERVNYNKNLRESAKNYKNIKHKISFLVGEKDYHLILNDFNKIKSKLKNADYHFYKNTAHFIQFEKANDLITIIKKHVDQSTLIYP